MHHTALVRPPCPQAHPVQYVAVVELSGYRFMVLPNMPDASGCLQLEPIDGGHRAWIHVPVQVCMCACMCACMCVCVDSCTSAGVHMRVHVRVHVRVRGFMYQCRCAAFAGGRPRANYKGVEWASGLGCAVGVRSEVCCAARVSEAGMHSTNPTPHIPDPTPSRLSEGGCKRVAAAEEDGRGRERLKRPQTASARLKPPQTVSNRLKPPQPASNRLKPPQPASNRLKPPQTASTRLALTCWRRILCQGPYATCGPSLKEWLEAMQDEQGVTEAELSDVLEEVKRSSLRSFRKERSAKGLKGGGAGAVSAGGFSVGERVIYKDRKGVPQDARVRSPSPSHTRTTPLPPPTDPPRRPQAAASPSPRKGIGPSEPVGERRPPITPRARWNRSSRDQILTCQGSPRARWNRSSRKVTRRASW